MNTSGGAWPGTALLEIPKHGFDINKLVIVKTADPTYNGSLSTGFMDPTTLSTCVDLASKAGWGGGIMGIRFPEANSAWIKTMVEGTELAINTNSSYTITTGSSGIDSTTSSQIANSSYVRDPVSAITVNPTSARAQVSTCSSATLQ